MDLKDFISSKNIALYMKELPQESSVDLALFPKKKQLGTEIEYAKGAKKKAVALRMSQFDTAAKTRALSATLDVFKKELPFFKESMGIKETDRRDLVLAMQSNNQEIVQALAKQVFENYENLINGAHIVAKRMRAEVIQNGAINITTEDGDVMVDYGVPVKHKAKITESSKKWNVATADIVGDIAKYQKTITDDHYDKPNIALMTEKTFLDTFMINTVIKNDLNGNISNQNRILSEKDFLNFAKERLGLSIVFLENATFIPNEGAEPMPYYVDGKVTFMSGTTLGSTVYGTTPEEFDKLYGSGKLDTSIVDLAIAVTTMVKEDPVSVDTKVSEMVLPSFDRADEVFFATVY
ncbi:MAG: phage capsid protein [Clostridium cadaveris]|uniref:Phage capsid protein n=1 Tax=Clostridium cadaveris TaxID=1529 RepID=A0A316M099_9CLOT|nr:MAG: phage capsid protein [Clostridium cadaveris]